MLALYCEPWSFRREIELGRRHFENYVPAYYYYSKLDGEVSFIDYHEGFFDSIDR